MPNDLPIEQDIFHLRTTTDVMDDHVSSAKTTLIHDNSNVGDSAAEVSRDDVSRRVVLQSRSHGQLLAFA